MLDANIVRLESSHFWLDLILGHMLAITVMDNLRRFPLLMLLKSTLPAKWTTGLNSQQSQFSRSKVQKCVCFSIDYRTVHTDRNRRLDSSKGRKDFLTNVSSKVHNGEVTKEEMAAHSSTFVYAYPITGLQIKSNFYRMAGGETTATTMSSITCYLLQSPASYQKLTHEIRSRFNSFEEIDITSSLRIPYLQAVIKEGMRILPASTQGLPRTSPGFEVDGRYIPAGVCDIQVVDMTGRSS